MSSAPTAAGKPEELTLRITGMHCAGCAASVQKAMAAEPGVESASVSVTEGRAVIAGRDLAPETLIAAVEKRGFTAESLDERMAPAELRSEIELRQQEQARKWRFRAIVGISLWIPLELLHQLAPDAWHGWVPWVLLAGSTIVLAVAGGGFYRSAFAAARRGTTNMDTLISMGATVAYVFSLVVFILQLTGTAAGQVLYFSESAALLGIISLGHWIEARATAQAGSAVRELLELQPDEAEVVGPDGTTTSVPSASVEPGQHILIRPGAGVPVDGVVTEGDSEIDESVVTGEPLPVLKQPGDDVVAGSVNTTGRLIITASVDGRSTTVARIAEIVQKAQSSKARIQRLADRVSAVFVPTVLSIALVTVVGWWIAGAPATGVIAAVTVLIISCPCALGLATPMAVMVGAGAASRHGILIKSAGSLERAGLSRRVVFDKTGTLTAGRPKVTGVETHSDAFDRTQLLRFAAAVEMPSEHPIARAVVQAAAEEGIEVPPVESFRAVPGEGVYGKVDGRKVEVRRDAAASCSVWIDDERAGSLLVSDTLRGDATEAVQRLKRMDIEVSMVSGDRRRVAEAIAGEVGIAPDHVFAEVTPQGKAEFVRELPDGTVMVGDGINDAAALAEADVGIAMGSGTTIAIESADVVIPSDHVVAVPETIQIARLTLRTIRQNLFFAFFYNAAAIPAAAFALLGDRGPLIAAAAMAFSDITVIGNALRLKGRLRKELGSCPRSVAKDGDTTAR